MSICIPWYRMADYFVSTVVPKVISTYPHKFNISYPEYSWKYPKYSEINLHKKQKIYYNIDLKQHASDWQIMHAPFFDGAQQFQASNQECSKFSKCVRRRLFLISEIRACFELFCLVYFIKEVVHGLVCSFKSWMYLHGKLGAKI